MDISLIALTGAAPGQSPALKALSTCIFNCHCNGPHTQYHHILESFSVPYYIKFLHSLILQLLKSNI